ncbi:aspartate carbamoyltransferase catalytic subunit [Virgibacillus litoralis]|uniref:Aspartate carbamoyltransferase n=1 Tax=Virgibacillus litoralis TaxID=578221 RepID=A0ABS4HIM1_9BACI|nr:aspartate carbamoyltransferase catalytic subunit [Virgibacillus litoralis]MBP1950733.1 aspartate carbamoyltransferase catalytic subunit [Virgibacillus litoralis]
MRHFLSTRNLSSTSIFHILNKAEELRLQQMEIPEQVFAANLFFEPSTRTKMCFHVAQKKLGIETLDFHMETSSVTKGESLYDTAKTYEAIGAKLLVIRHQMDNWVDGLIPNLSLPVINAGSGKGEHPTQCMLDLLTIHQEFGTFTNLNVVIVGDIKHSRVARSNAYALTTLGANVYFAAAPGFEDDTLDFPYISIDEAVEMCDIMMLLRIQHERHTVQQYDSTSYLVQFGLTKERESRMKDHAIILHPAPVNRGVEIDTELVECQRSRIFKQMENGVYTRMAIMIILLKEWGYYNEAKTNKCQKITW